MTGQSQAIETSLFINGNRYAHNGISNATIHTVVDNSKVAITGEAIGNADDVGAGIKVCRFTTYHTPHRGDFEFLLERGGFSLEDDDLIYTATIPSNEVVMGLVAKNFKYTSAMVDSLSIRGQRGSKAISMELNWIAANEVSGVALPSTDIVHGFGYAFNGGALFKSGGVSKEFSRFMLSFNNHLNPEFNNSVTFTSACPSQQTISLGVSTPYTSSESSLYSDIASPVVKKAGELNFTNGTDSTSFSFAAMIGMGSPPKVMRGQELRLNLFYDIKNKGAENAVTVSHST